MSQTIFFISDLHLGHEGIFGFGQRTNVGGWNGELEKLIDQWNSKVRKQRDIVYILGDVAFNPEALTWLQALNGTKRIVLGNHDTMDYNVYKKYAQKVYWFHKAYHGLVLTHIPIHPGELEYRNWSVNVHGHVHTVDKNVSLRDDPRYFNVNVDALGTYAPISLEELREGIRANKGAT
jgi:calcineurin-like phosphoesterase family protein